MSAGAPPVTGMVACPDDPTPGGPPIGRIHRWGGLTAQATQEDQHDTSYPGSKRAATSQLTGRRHSARIPTPAGTGFFVSPQGWFLTAAHVVTENGKPDGPPRQDICEGWLMQAPPPGGGWVRMCSEPRLDHVDPRNDIAILQVDFQTNSRKDWLTGADAFPYIPISVRLLDEGEPVYSFGYPLSSAGIIANGHAGTFGSFAHCPRVTSAIVSSTLERSSLAMSAGDQQVYVLDKALNFGNSGGPIVAAETGNAHAVCSGFQPVRMPQPHLVPPLPPDRPFVVVPSLYGVVTGLANPEVVKALEDRGIPIART